MTTFGESDIPIDISGAVAAAKNIPLPFREQSISMLLADHGPNWRQSRVEFQNELRFLPHALSSRCWVCRSGFVRGEAGARQG